MMRVKPARPVLLAFSSQAGRFRELTGRRDVQRPDGYCPRLKEAPEGQRLPCSGYKGQIGQLLPDMYGTRMVMKNNNGTRRCIPLNTTVYELLADKQVVTGASLYETA